MSDLISRSALKNTLQARHDFYIKSWGGFSNMPFSEKSRVDELTSIIAEIINAPTVEPERPQGEWKFKKFDEKTGIPNSDWCPFCGMVKAQVYDNFCGNCGADMRGGVE